MTKDGEMLVPSHPPTTNNNNNNNSSMEQQQHHHQWFSEIRRTDDSLESPSFWIEHDGFPPKILAYALVVEPKQCSSLVKQLALDFPLGTKKKKQNNLQIKINNDGKEGRDVEPEVDSKTTLKDGDRRGVKVDLSHLKRVHKQKQEEEEGCPSSTTTTTVQEPSSKKRKISVQLLVLLGAVIEIDPLLNLTNQTNDPKTVQERSPGSQLYLASSLEQLIAAHGPLKTVHVPARPPSSKDEWTEWNNQLWPTTYDPMSWQEYQEQQLALDSNEVEQMKRNIDQLLHGDSDIPTASTFFETQQKQQQNYQSARAIVVDPATDKIMASSWVEEEEQQEQLARQEHLQSDKNTRRLCDWNPLATPIPLALQGVSRLERQESIPPSKTPLQDAGKSVIIEAASSSTPSQSEKKKENQQYLCTGYDLYTTYEPTVFEAMSCVHARLRRLIYFDPSSSSLAPEPASTPTGSNTATTGASAVPAAYRNAVRGRRAFEKGCSLHFVHCLPGTNHHYRVFQYTPPSLGRNDDGMPLF